MRIRCCPYSSFRAVAEHAVLVVASWAAEPLSAEAFGLPKPLSAKLSSWAKAHRFTGANKQQVALRRLDADSMPFAGVVLVGLGRRADFGSAQRLRMAGTAVRLARSMGGKHLLLAAPGIADAKEPPLREALLTAQGLSLGLYRFGDCRKPLRGDDQKALEPPKDAFVLVPEEYVEDANEAVGAGVAIAEAVARARNWVNTPANLLGPPEFAARAEAEGKAAGLKVKVLEEPALRREKMGLLLGVGQGSRRPPRLVHVSYEGGASGEAPVVLVGKGITFDSGGLCIKPCEGMSTMKMDMGGAAAVLATIGAAARLQLPVTVHALLALAENMPSADAIRPGDILTSAEGITVEVNNTDAEGRLVLADAIHYAKRLNPAVLIDVATLTGACMVALGPTTAGLFSSRDEVASALLDAGREAGEDVWRMPLTRSLREQLKSDCADMRNTGDRYGGAITAALFLQEFVGDVPWAHLDIAGPAWGSEEGAHLSKGGTGAAVATLLRYLMHRASSESSERPAPKAPRGGRRTRRRGS